ncbi:MAG: squalene cyclase, partial [Rhodothermales bacterium]
MNMITNSKQRFLTGALCFFMASVTAVPLAAQEKPAEAEAPEMTEQTEKAIERGLTFLISSQNKDGSWSTKDPAKDGGGGYA